MTAKMVIASAARLIEVRHFWRKRKRIAEMSVPACPIPTQNTKFVMSHAQPTGTLSPQTPIPSQKSHETAMPSSPRSVREGKKKNHQPLDRPRDGLGDGVEIRRAEDERRIARDRVVEQLCFRLGQACSPDLSLKSGRWYLRRLYYHRGSRESSAETGVTPHARP